MAIAATCANTRCHNRGKYVLRELPGVWCGIHKKSALKDFWRAQALALLAELGVRSCIHPSRDLLVVNTEDIFRVLGDAARWKTFYETFDDSKLELDPLALLADVERL